MSPIGRMFIVLNLVLAACFLGWASNSLATSQEFKKKYDDEVTAHQAAVAERDSTIDQLTQQKQQAESNANLERDQKDRERLRAERAEEQVASLEAEKAELNASVTKLSESFDAMEASRTRLEGEVTRAIQEKNDAIRAKEGAERAQDAAEMAQSEAEEQLANARREIEDQELAIAGLEREKTSLETQLQTLVDVTDVTLADIAAQPLIEGAVIKAMYDVPPGLVALNIGSDAGVKRGMTFDIAQGKDYKGRVRVMSVREQMCTARIIDPIVPGATIRQGDLAATRF